MEKRMETFPLKALQATVLFIVGAFVGVLAEQIVKEYIISSQIALLLLVLACLLFISYTMGWLAKSTDEIRQNVGLRIVYFDRERHGRAALFKEARRVVERAQQSIFILNSVITEVGEEREDTEEIQERDRYYDALINRAQNGITYERVIQLKPSQSVAEAIKDVGYIKHFHKMLDVKEAAPQLAIGLMKAPAKRLSTFVLVDDEILVWQINEVTPTGNAKMYGIFVIYDPRHEITQHFKAFAESAKRESLGAVQKYELPPLVPAG